MLLVGLLVNCLTSTPVLGQTDSLQTRLAPDSLILVRNSPVANARPPAGDVPRLPGRRPHSPRLALVRSLIVPGWGQLYNGQWYKIPFVYAGLGATAVMAARNTQQHREARHAFLFASGIGSQPNPYVQYESAYQAFDGAGADRLFQHKNGLRRNRDLSFFAIGIVYALTTLDAFINAHLVDFDIDADLSPDGSGSEFQIRARLKLAPN